MSLVNKLPGMSMKVTSRNLDLQYKDAFPELIPDAYESLLLNVIEGDRSLFICNDELEAAWDIFTPVLHEIEKRQVCQTPPLLSVGLASSAYIGIDTGDAGIVDWLRLVREVTMGVEFGSRGIPMGNPG